MWRLVLPTRRVVVVVALVAAGFALPMAVPSSLTELPAREATESAAFVAPSSTTSLLLPAPATADALPALPAPPPPALPERARPRPAPAAAPAVIGREAWLWPFSADSPWNAGVGAAARYEDAAAPQTAALIRGDLGAWVNADQYSHPVYRASVLDPVATVRMSNGATAQYRIPNSARPCAGSDANLHVVDPTGRWLDESWHMSGENPSWTSGYHRTTDLFGSGFGTGVRASGASAAGGLIRRWELDRGSIRHALALAITGAQLRRGPVWPATGEDGNAASTYSGPVPMGALVAIPRGVDVNALGLSPIGVVLARAMQDYGVFVVDRTDGAIALYAEPVVGGAQLTALRDAFKVLRGKLRIVSDNGGGRVVPLPPALH